jgi:hypothetical protein
MVEVPARSQRDGGEGVETRGALVGTSWMTCSSNVAEVH